MSSRITVDGDRVSIASRKFWPLLIFWGIWLAIWTVGGITAFYSLVLEKLRSPLGVLLAAIIGWSAVALCVAFFWLWFAFGKEVVSTTEDKLILRNEILGHGRSKVFPLERVMNLRASGLFGSFFTWSGMFKIYALSGGVIAFDCDGQTHRFGKLLEEDEAQEIIKQLRSRIGPLSSGSSISRTQ